MQDPRFTFSAYDGEMTIFDHKVVLSPKGFLTKISKGSTGDKDIDIEAISAVQIKKPGLTSGFIQLTIRGEQAARGGAFNAAQDENALILRNKKQYAEALQAKQIVEAIKARGRHSAATPPPVADDPMVMLEKLAALHAAGHLTDDEFGSKKSEILSRI